MDFKQASDQVLALLRQTIQGANKDAENSLQALASQPGYGLVLATLLSNQQLNKFERQQAGVVLKQHVRTHWDRCAQYYEPPTVSDSEKEEIRKIVTCTNVLGDPISKIQTSGSMLIAEIAKWDYPERWPHLFETLFSYLIGDVADLRKAALQAIEFLCEHILPQDFPKVLPRLFPILQRIFLDGHFSVIEKCRAVSVYRTLVGTLVCLQDEEPEFVKKLLRPTLLDWLKGFASVYEATGEQKDSEESFDLKVEVTMTVSDLIKNYPQAIRKHLEIILNAMWRALINSLPIYQHRMLDEGQLTQKGTSESFLDDCCEVLNSIAGCENRAIMDSLIPKFEDIGYVLIYLCQMTHEMVELFKDDPNAFIAAEMDEDPSGDWDLRRSGSATLALFLDTYEDKQLVPAVIKACQLHLAEAEEARKAGNAIWWKKREAVMYMSGFLADHLRAGHGLFDVEAFARQVLIPMIAPQNTNYYLRARAISSGSHFVDHLSGESRSLLIKGIVHGFDENVPLPVRLSASRSFGLVCVYICDGLLKQEDVTEYLPVALKSYVQLLNVAEDEVLHMTLETFAIVLKLNPSVTAAAEPSITPLLIKAWEKNTKSPEVTMNVREVLESMAQTGVCVPSLQTHVTPTIMTILQAAEKQQSGTIEAAIEILQCIVEFNKGPLPDIFISQVFPLLLPIIMTTDDHSVMQAGANCISVFVKLAAPQIVNGTIGGKSMIEAVFQVAGKLLSPEIEDAAAFTVGALVTQLLSKAGDHLGQAGTSELLLAVVRRLYIAELPTLEQSLILVFARLIQQHGKQIIDFLGEAGEVMISNRDKTETHKVNVIQFILNRWVVAHTDVQGLYYIKVSLTALSQLLLLRDGRISNIPVQGYLIIDTNSGRRTRSMGPPKVQHSALPFYSKVLYILVQQWQLIMDDEKPDAGDFGDEYNNDDSFWQDDTASQSSQGSRGSRSSKNANYDIAKLTESDLVTLSQIYDSVPLFEDDSELLSHEELSDPIYKIDLKSYISGFVKDLMKDRELLSQLANHLNEKDQTSLKLLLGQPAPV